MTWLLTILLFCPQLSPQAVSRVPDTLFFQVNTTYRWSAILSAQARLCTGLLAKSGVYTHNPLNECNGDLSSVTLTVER